MKRPLQILTCVIAVAALALTCIELTKLMDIGTCASGGPYVSARPCPDGTGGRMLLLMGAILVYTVALIASGQGMFLFGLLFIALAAVFVRGGITDDDFGAVGFGVGGMFAVMGLVPMVLAIRGWLDGDDTAARSRAAGIASFTQMAQQGMMAPAPSPVVFATPPRRTDDLARLQELGDLHARGVLTDSEFATEKARILGGGI
jgi:Short C-terminal domain